MHATRRLRLPQQSGQQVLLTPPNQDGTTRVGCPFAGQPLYRNKRLSSILRDAGARLPGKEPHPQAGSACGAGGGRAFCRRGGRRVVRRPPPKRRGAGINFHPLRPSWHGSRLACACWPHAAPTPPPRAVPLAVVAAHHAVAAAAVAAAVAARPAAVAFPVAAAAAAVAHSHAAVAVLKAAAATTALTRAVRAVAPAPALPTHSAAPSVPAASPAVAAGRPPSSRAGTSATVPAPAPAVFLLLLLPYCCCNPRRDRPPPSCCQAAWGTAEGDAAVPAPLCVGKATGSASSTCCASWTKGAPLSWTLKLTALPTSVPDLVHSMKQVY